MAQAPVSPVVLVILDGWGVSESTRGNAIAAAKTPVMDSLRAAYPNTTIHTSGKAVGLPEGQMGNSEVGHMNIGAGRIVKQELLRITDAVEDGSILSNPALVKVCQAVKNRKGKLHLMGLCSEGGVHSHQKHLIGLLSLAKAQGLTDVCIHAITDGRDTSPREGAEALAKIEAAAQEIGVGRIVTLSGRYYAMDRDNRWNRVEMAYKVMTTDGPGDGRSVIEHLHASYLQDLSDEFVLPVRIAPGAVESGDGVIFFNFRPDRSRQLTSAFVSPHFQEFEREKVETLSFATFTQYDSELPVLVAFEPQNLSNIFGEVIANHGLRQFRAAETEKYAHVTYFFNGGLEDPFEGEDRELVQSPMVPTYDQAPEMSAEAVTDVMVAAVKRGIYSLMVVNYANPDMVGHTGNIEATITAVQTVDRCVGRLLDAIGQAGGTTLIIADHGNAEYMMDEEGNPWTAHTTNPVPLIVVEGEGRKIPGHGAEVKLRTDACLADIAPTLLQILQLPQPQEMTGRSAIESPILNLQPSLEPLRIPV